MSEEPKSTKLVAPDLEAARMPAAGVRYGLMALGWLCVAAGGIGIFLPLLPTTPFLLVALWCFSQSSQRFHDWLYSHPRLGPPLRDWHRYRVIPLRAKLVAVSVMAVSFLYVTLYVAETWVLPLVIAAVLLPSATFIVTRRSRKPEVPFASGP